MFDALIVGGGPAGSTTALLLARAGFSVALVEKKNFPRGKVCGEYISATSLPLMKELGIADFYLNQGGPEVKRVGLYAADTMLTSRMPPVENTFGKWGRALKRDQLDNLLLNEARNAGTKIWQPWCATKLKNHGTHFTCSVTSTNVSEEISARIVIIAQGSWENGLIKNQSAAHKNTDFLAFKAHFTHGEMDQDLMPLIAFPGGYGGLVHSDSECITLSCSIRRDALQYARAQNRRLSAGDAVLQHIISTCKGAHTVLGQAERVDPWFSAGPLRPGIRTGYQDGLFFVGNIAGEAHPIVAEGISMAMQSGWLLASTLTGMNDNNLANAGRHYCHQWRTHFANRIRAAALFTQCAIRPRAIAFLLPIFKRYPGLLTYGAKVSGKVRQISIQQRCL